MYLYDSKTENIGIFRKIGTILFKTGRMVPLAQLSDYLGIITSIQ